MLEVMIENDLLDDLCLTNEEKIIDYDVIMSPINSITSGFKKYGQFMECEYVKEILI